MSEHILLADCIQQSTGVVLHDKPYLFENRLGPLMKEYGLKTFDEVARCFSANTDVGLHERVVETMTTHETRFFRDEHVFDAFNDQIVPEWLARQREESGGQALPELRIWSAACSTGQEPYSIAISILEKSPGLAKRVRIVATDLSAPTLKRAVEGRYSAFEVQRGLPAHLLERYFSKDQSLYVAKDVLRRMIEFRTQNLVSDPAPGRFDIVFCRNVAIYFTAAERTRLYQKISNSLSRDGVLVLGSAESPTGYYDHFVRRERGLAQYYEMNMSRVTWFAPPGAGQSPGK